MSTSETKVPTKKLESNSKSEFDHLKYFLHFESVFIEKEISLEFEHFLKSEYNDGPLLYLNEVCEFKSLKERKSKLRKVKEIIENFFLEGSVHELTTSKKSNSLLLEIYESILLQNSEKQNDLRDWTLSQTFENILEPITRSVKQEMYHDSWKRFLRTEIVVYLVQKFHKNTLICSPQLTKSFDYTDDYFDHPFIFDKDFEFIDLVFKDSFDWKLVQANDKSKTNAFISRLNYFPQVSHAKNSINLKFECILPISLQTLAFVYSTNKNKSNADNFISLIQTHEFYDFETLKSLFQENGWKDEIGAFERNLAVNVSHLHFPYIFTPRIHNHGCSMKYEPESETLTILHKPYIRDGLKFSEASVMDICPEKGKPMKKMKAYNVFAFTYYKFQKIDDKKVFFCHGMTVDFAGWVSNNETLLSKMIVNAKISSFKEKLLKYVSKFPQDIKIEDHKEELCKEENGKIIDGMGKLLCELNIDKQNEEFLNKTI
jgi:hypothetical protein